MYTIHEDIIYKDQNNINKYTKIVKTYKNLNKFEEIAIYKKLISISKLKKKNLFKLPIVIEFINVLFEDLRSNVVNFKEYKTNKNLIIKDYLVKKHFNYNIEYKYLNVTKIKSIYDFSRIIFNKYLNIIWKIVKLYDINNLKKSIEIIFKLNIVVFLLFKKLYLNINFINMVNFIKKKRIYIFYLRKKLNKIIIFRLLNILKKLSNLTKKLKSKLIYSNFKLVINISKKYIDKGIDLLDLIQEGNIGLIKASNRFNYTFKYRFATYAIWWVKQRIYMILKTQLNVIKQPNNKYDIYSYIIKISNKYKYTYNKRPTLEELSTLSLIKTKKIKKIFLYSKISSMDSEIYENSTLNDITADKMLNDPFDEFNNNYEINNKTVLLTKFMSSLNFREEWILRLRFGLNIKKKYTLKEIGINLNLTKERIRQIINVALNKLKKASIKKNEINNINFIF